MDHCGAQKAHCLSYPRNVSIADYTDTRFNDILPPAS